MEVRVLLFGAEAKAAGRPEVRVCLPHARTCAALKAEVARAVPSIASLVPAARVAVNAEFALPEQMIGPGDEVALIGMVSGG